MRLFLFLKSFFERHRLSAREIALSLAAALIYFGIRSFTAGSAHDALANAARLMRWEETAHIAWERSLQVPMIASLFLVALVNWIYIWGHWPVIIITAIVLFKYRPDEYRLLRNAIFVSAAIGFLFFAFFPVAPPRLADPELVDTVTLYSHSYRALQPPGLTNQFAAFPSLHFGWNVLVGVAIWKATSNKALRLAAVAQAAIMGAAVVLTANHFIIDVAGGFVVVLVGLAGHEVITSLTSRRHPPGGEPAPLLHSK